MTSTDDLITARDAAEDVLFAALARLGRRHYSTIRLTEMDAPAVVQTVAAVQYQKALTEVQALTKVAEDLEELCFEREMPDPDYLFDEGELS